MYMENHFSICANVRNWLSLDLSIMYMENHFSTCANIRNWLSLDYRSCLMLHILSPFRYGFYFSFFICNLSRFEEEDKHLTSVKNVNWKPMNPWLRSTGRNGVPGLAAQPAPSRSSMEI